MRSRRHSILLDNTLLTSAARAIRSGHRASQFDFLSLVDLVQAFVCYDHVIFDNSSRQSDQDIESWDRVTDCWKNAKTFVFSEQPIAMNADIDSVLDHAARRSLQDVSLGHVHKSYLEVLSSLGTSNLLPEFYFVDNGFDDERFLQAENWWREHDKSVIVQLDQHPLSRPLARYIFRGYYYLQIARTAGIDYSPCALRGKLMDSSTLFRIDPQLVIQERVNQLDPGGDLVQILRALGVGLGENRVLEHLEWGLTMPLTFNYVLKLCRDNKWEIPEATYHLRLDSRMVELRAVFKEIKSIVTLQSLDGRTRKKLNVLSRKIIKWVETYELSNGIKSAQGNLPATMAKILTLIPIPGIERSSTVLEAIFSFTGLENNPNFKYYLPSYLFFNRPSEPSMIMLWELLDGNSHLPLIRKEFDDIFRNSSD